MITGNAIAQDLPRENADEKPDGTVAGKANLS
jgi:hypothetical protein